VTARGEFERLQIARILAVVVPAALLAGAWSFQIWGGLFPCEMCWWQRYAHTVALALALCAIGVARRPGPDRLFLVLAALAILVSGAIGAYHAGVEAHVFRGFTQCTRIVAPGASTDELLRQIMDSPIVRCDQVQWRFLGVSMAGWNAIISALFGLLILWLTLTRPRPRP
jgi:disulfide bond formation protein DsbB